MRISAFFNEQKHSTLDGLPSPKSYPARSQPVVVVVVIVVVVVVIVVVVLILVVVVVVKTEQF